MEIGFASEYVSYSTFWFTLALLNAGLAQTKKRSGLRWGLISLFVGPIATAFLVVWPPGDYTGEPIGWHTTWGELGLVVLAVILVGLVIFALVNWTQ
jgi:hypothetical protein